ncbi:MAG: hypothetical protein QGH33_16280, partial [Pirellulaceae bacterium]|nr:hypothetical protein [Pirellulaceae bacterium]
MASELRRAFVRLVANYGRMFANILLGLWMLRLLLQGLHQEGFGLVGLLGSTVGITKLVQQTVSQSLVRELGTAYHEQDPHVFRGTYHSALLLSAFATVAVLFVFGVVIIAILPVLEMSDAMRPSARWFLIAMACQSLLGVMLAPIRNMYLIKEQMVAVNVLGILRTARRTASAFAVAMVEPDPVLALIMFGVLSSGLSIVVQLTAAAIVVVRDRRLIPSLSCASFAGVRSILRLGGWNMIMLVAMDLHVHVGAFIMNLAFGAAFGNTIWHLATRLTGYVRRVAEAAQRGTDAVAVRVDVKGGADAVRQLLHHTTRFN